MFQLQELDPQTYRRQTRHIAFALIALFASLAMLLAGLAVYCFGTPGGDNFHLNLGGVFAGLLLTLALVRLKLWTLPWMAPAVYGWQLKRNLMRITNGMHRVSAAVEAGDPLAMRILRFYHLGLGQMHRLDGNSSGQLQLLAEVEAHRQRMLEQGLDPEQRSFDPAWMNRLGERV
jgi:hypothetical protein